MLGRQEGRVPILGAIRGHSAQVGHHHEGGQVFVERAQSVARPAAHARESRGQESGGLEQGRLRMDTALAHQVVDEGHVIDTATEWGHDLAEVLTALAVGFEFPGGGEGGAQSVLEKLHGLAGIPFLSVVFFEEGFVVPEIDMACGSGHEELDHPLGPWACGGCLGTRRRCGG